MVKTFFLRKAVHTGKVLFLRQLLEKIFVMDMLYISIIVIEKQLPDFCDLGTKGMESIERALPTLNENKNNKNNMEQSYK